MRRVLRPSAQILSALGLGRFIVPLALLALLAPGAARPVAHSVPAVQAAPQVETATMFPEVRLRKLHLVRPDLIPYPLCYEVYC